MDLDFAAAGRRLEKERNAQRRAAEQRRKAEAAAAKRAAEAAARVEELAAARRQERLAAAAAAREAEEASHRINFSAALKAVPWVKADTNRVALPKSVLESLEQQRALDWISGPLTFRLEVDVLGSKVITHCGVDEFTAEEGTIAIPPTVALSLSRDEGVDSLVGKRVHVCFTELDHVNKVKVEFQPRGKGFHTENEDVVNIDIKSVLLRTLRDTMTLTEGDWIPMRHEGKTYHLVARKVEPESAVVLINTDVEVEILPSEFTEQQELKARARQEALLARNKRLEELRANLPPEPAEASTAIRVRIPSGTSHTRRFQSTAKLNDIFDWVDTLMPEEVPEEVEEFQIQLVRNSNSPRDRSTLFRRDGGKDLSELGVGPRESWLANWCTSQLSREPTLDETPAAAHKILPNKTEATTTEVGEMQVDAMDIQGENESEALPKAFSQAVKEAEAKLDESIQTDQLKSALENASEPEEAAKVSADKVHVFHAMVANGMNPYQAAQAAQKYSDQIAMLETMGFSQDWPRSIELLDKYQGRLERVVNILAGGD
mmetsp:Transcript_8296/g.15245  ORF Transcript_8296/g.15245 Transcript_8296/m.15245 type:complete len:546 (-) Transcript_8296:96-1733(-)